MLTPTRERVMVEFDKADAHFKEGICKSYFENRGHYKISGLLRFVKFEKVTSRDFTDMFSIIQSHFADHIIEMDVICNTCQTKQ